MFSSDIDKVLNTPPCQLSADNLIPVASCSLLVDIWSETKVPHRGIAGKETMEGLYNGENGGKDRKL